MKKITTLLGSFTILLTSGLVNAQTFTNGAGVTDVDGNVYTSVIYENNQEWLVQNLKTTKYSNGESITNFTSPSNWTTATTGGWGFPDNNSINNDPYGKLYNGIAVQDSRNLCPTDWHVPSQTEWSSLIIELGGIDLAGGKMKVSGIDFWLAPNTGATNSVGFSAYPAGGFDDLGNHEQLTTDAFWWSSTEYQAGFSWFFGLGNSHTGIGSNANGNKAGFSVRCMKNTSGAGMNEDSGLNQIQVYPNPTDDQIQVSFKNNALGSNFVIMDQIGKEVIKGGIYSESMTINLEKLTQGVYFFGVENQNLVKIIKK
ncbi:MAG: FISUMP domain-containing protein [Bacteroidota bacterium]